MPEEPTEPMDVDDECPGYDYVIVYLDGRRQCYDGDPDRSGLDSWVENGRYLIEQAGMPPPPGGG
ncbi:MAG: hypothetical protein R3D28_21355 [Geminicoccaceae bacterium]